jgi:hypothetical protein
VSPSYLWMLVKGGLNVNIEVEPGLGLNTERRPTVNFCK